MDRNDLVKYVAYALDDTGSTFNHLGTLPENARIVAWQCGFEPMAVAVWSYTGAMLDDDEAEELASDYLDEIGWFSDGPSHADFIV